MCIAKRQNTEPQKRIEPETHLFEAEHSTTERLCYSKIFSIERTKQLYRLVYTQAVFNPGVHFESNVYSKQQSSEVKQVRKWPIIFLIYQSPLILTELFQHNLINVSYLTACYLYQVMMTLRFLNDVANDTESAQKSKITS